MKIGLPGTSLDMLGHQRAHTCQPLEFPFTNTFICFNHYLKSTPWTASLASSTEVTFVLYTYLLANILFRYYIQQLYHFYSMQNETPAPSAIMVLPILSPSANIGGPEGSMNFIWSCHSNVFCIGMKVLWSRHYYKINFKHKCSFISKHIVGLTAKNDGYFIFGPRQKFC